MQCDYLDYYMDEKSLKKKNLFFFLTFLIKHEYPMNEYEQKNIQKIKCLTEKLYLIKQSLFMHNFEFFMK
jgi:hypothetical protein